MTKQENYDFFTEFKKKLKENKIKKIEKIEKDLMLDIFYSRKYSVLINSILNDN
jgi:hypothetical protein